MNLRYSVQNGLQCRDECGLLLILRRRGGRFQNDFKRARADFRRRAQDAVVFVGNDAVAGAEAVNDLAFVAREQFLGGLQRGFDQMLRERCAVGEPVKTVARVVGVQRNDSLKRTRNQFGLQAAGLPAGSEFFQNSRFKSFPPRENLVPSSKPVGLQTG